MPFTNSDYLPSYEELDVPEIGMTAAPMRAGARYFGKYCDMQSKEFMLCNQEEKDPRKCLQEGKEVTRCGIEFFRKVKQHCAAEFTEYWKCLDTSSWDMCYSGCRTSQAVFDTCMKDKLGMDRQELGFFSKVRIHSTNRPKPVHTIQLPEAIPGPDDINRSEPPPDSVKQGTRGIYI